MILPATKIEVVGGDEASPSPPRAADPLGRTLPCDPVAGELPVRMPKDVGRIRIEIAADAEEDELRALREPDTIPLPPTSSGLLPLLAMVLLAAAMAFVMWLMRG